MSIGTDEAAQGSKSRVLLVEEIAEPKRLIARKAVWLVDAFPNRSILDCLYGAR